MNVKKKTTLKLVALNPQHKFIHISVQSIHSSLLLQHRDEFVPLLRRHSLCRAISDSPFGTTDAIFINNFLTVPEVLHNNRETTISFVNQIWYETWKNKERKKNLANSCFTFPCSSSIALEVPSAVEMIWIWHQLPRISSDFLLQTSFRS